VPKEIRDRLGIEAGDDLEFTFDSEQLVVVPVRRRRLSEFRGVIPLEQGEVLSHAEERARARDSRLRRYERTENGAGY
jgi:AbrB family looped-hinge helix DNA binding protein